LLKILEKMGVKLKISPAEMLSPLLKQCNDAEFSEWYGWSSAEGCFDWICSQIEKVIPDFEIDSIPEKL
jgi:hypothetical protein